MFSSIRVSGYKGIVDLNLYKIPRILLIGGRNNVGKSSLLEAIFLALDRMNPELLSRHFSFRGTPSIPLNADALWRPAFHNYNLSEPIEIELCDAKSKLLTLKVRHDSTYTEYNIQQPNIAPADSKKSSTSSSGSAVQALHITATYDKKQVQDSHLTIQGQGFVFQVKHGLRSRVGGVYISSTARSSPREDAGRFGQLDLENKADQILRIVQLVEPRISRLSVIAIGEGVEIHADVEGFPRKIPISLMGDGVGRILSITLSILVTTDGVVLVDEVENGLHHSKLPEFWTAVTRACITANCQLIATTHNYECLAAASKSAAMIDPSCFSYVRFDRAKESGKLTAVQYSNDELSAALEAEFEVR